MRNEAEHLEAVVASVERQSRPPDMWLIVDDDSTDDTARLLGRLQDRIGWLRVASVPDSYTVHQGDRLAAAAVERAYNWGLGLLDWRAFTHIGKLDGDILLPADYLERVLERFHREPRLGVAGGALTEQLGGEWVTVPTPADLATGPARIYSRACLQAVGGIPERLGADGIAVTYARMNGFTARTFSDLPVRHLRRMGSAQGALRGRARQGAAHYVVHYTPPWAVLRAGKLALHAPPRPLSGPAFLSGYLRAAAGGTPRVEDPAFRAFMHADQRRRAGRALRRGQDTGSTMTREQRRRRLDEVLHALESYGDQRQWGGSDPYDGLNATRFVGPLTGTVRGRQLVIQAVKRCPVDLRPALGIAPGRNSATVAWAVSSYARGGFLPAEECEAKLTRTVEMLERLRSPGYEEPCWGYDFDCQSRVFFYPRGAPNTIATVFAGMALLDAYERTGDEALLDEAMGVGRFFLRHVPQTPAARGAYFGYLVGDRSPIHNANTHVCALLARLARHVEADEFRDVARRGVEYALALQRADGSWLYGERPNLAWVDGYHHGYVLDALRVCAEADLDPRLPEAVRRGLEYYRRELLLEDGTPKYFSDSVYPIDTQSAAQAIQTFAIASSDDPSHLEVAWRVFEWSVRHLRREDGLFIFQRRRFWTNQVPHMRWVVASLLLALTHLRNADVAARPPVTPGA